MVKILQRLTGPDTAAAVRRIYDEAGAYLVDAAQPHGNTLEPAGAGRVVGSNELRDLFNQRIT